MVLGKKVAIFDWEWGLNSPPRDGQKIPWYSLVLDQLLFYCIGLRGPIAAALFPAIFFFFFYYS